MTADGLRKISLSVLPALFMFACDVRADRELRHPVLENIPTDGASVLSRSSEPTSRFLSRATERLRGRELLRRIGSLDGPSHTVFGSIAEIAADREHFYVLDDRLNRVIMYSAAGDFVATFGGTGDGPLEFRSPEDLEVLRGDLLLLSTRSGYRVFRLLGEDEGTEVELANAIRLSDGSPRDVCNLGTGDILVRNGNSTSALLHKVVLSTGEAKHSFGYRYGSDNELVTSRYTDGNLSCSLQAQTALAGWQGLPFVQAYSFDGIIRWTVVLSDFDPIPVIEFTTPDGKPAVRTELEAGGDVLLASSSIGEGFLLQVGHFLPPDQATGSAAIERVDTYLIDATTGEGAYVGDDLPVIFAVVDDRIYAAGGTTYPELMIFRY